MLLTEDNSNPTLSAGQAEALNSVDLHLAFGNHGYYERDNEHGAMLLGISDKEYEGVASFVDSMSAQRGDVLAREAIGYDESPGPDQLVRALRVVDARSPHLQTKAFEGLEQLEPDALAGYFRLGRDLRILSPVDYAEGKAVEHSIRVAYADANAAAMEDWVSLEGKKNTAFRNRYMVAALGEIAAEMANGGGEQSQLRFIAGLDHRRGIERLLAEGGVNYSSMSFGPSRRIRDSLHNTQLKTHMAVPNVVPSPVGRDIGVWKRNLRSKLSP